MICKKSFLIKLPSFIFLFILFQSKGYTQNNAYCDFIWASISRYQSGEAPNILGTNRKCLTDSLKNKLISIVRREYTEEDLEAYIVHSRGKDWLRFIENHTWDLIGKDSSRYETVRDSLIDEKNALWRKSALNRGVEKSITDLIGKLDIKEAIPDLHTLLNSSKGNDFSIQLALARLEDSIYYPLFLERYSQPIILDYEKPYLVREQLEERSWLMYILTQESVYRFAKYLKVDFGFETSSIYYHVGYKVVSFLFNKVQNEDFQQIFVPFFDVNEWYTDYTFMNPYKASDIDRSLLENAYKWMEENKGNYILYRD